MNRFNVAVLLFILTLPVFSQESDTLSVIQNSDTLSSIQNYDSIYQFTESGFLHSDTLPEPDSLQVVEVRKPKSPSRALLYAMVLPGLGQAYNGKYWKIPIVWGALGVSGYAIFYNTQQYEQAVRDYLVSESDDDRIVRGWRRNMELSYIVTALIYGLQILDAYVDANLYSWEVNDNLSLGISPSLQPMMSHTSLSGYSGGLTCSFKIRGR
ncbi:MAG: hypothetical protein IMY68_12905 [Bacteroidetes bacterium]|nr:hypothetical protein [Bacteroidota bacterium]